MAHSWYERWAVRLLSCPPRSACLESFISPESFSPDLSAPGPSALACLPLMP